MRGHGFASVGESLPVAVCRAIYTELNARLQGRGDRLAARSLSRRRGSRARRRGDPLGGGQALGPLEEARAGAHGRRQDMSACRTLFWTPFPDAARGLRLPAARRKALGPRSRSGFIVPSAPGGGTDIYARLLAQALGEALGAAFVVDNRPGASGNIGAAAAARSAPDGFTFMVSANPSLSVNPEPVPDLPYDPERDFAPITRGVMAPMVIVVLPELAGGTLAELVALGKSQPGKLAYGSGGPARRCTSACGCSRSRPARALRMFLQGRRRRLRRPAWGPDRTSCFPTGLGDLAYPLGQAASHSRSRTPRRCCPACRRSPTPAFRSTCSCPSAWWRPPARRLRWCSA